ncbi:MAG: Ig-like domain-containing protein [Dysgonomonadaceae bacterium]|nr:Ig-like domain-containing protein [Dysgonamonadaceae bacterium]
MKKILFLLSIYILLIGCSKEDTPVVTSISFDKNEISIKVGESETLKVIHEPSDLPVPSYTWESSNEDVATITNGKVTAMSVGEATIKVTAAELGLSASCKIKVNPVEAETIVLNTTNQELKIGDEFQLTATIEPENTTDKSITWESNDDKIATVTEEGLVKAVGVGKAIITVTSGNVSVTCNIEVEPIQVTGISLSHEDIEIEITDEFELQATISPEDATNKKIIWSSSDEKIAKVSENGLITGLGEGKTIITAKSEDGGHTAQVNVTVNIKGIKLVPNNISLAFPNGGEIIYVFSHNNKVYLGATWTSDNPEIAAVTAVTEYGVGTNRALIKAKGEGETIITATSAGGLKTATCTVKVEKIKVQQIVINHSSLSLLPTETKQLSALVYPENAYNKELNWSSSNPTVASITQDGLLQANQVGSTTITVKSQDGGATATCTVNVDDITSFISLSFDTFGAPGPVIINGFLTGDMYSVITNNSNQTIELTSLYIYDGYSGRLVGRSTDPTLLGYLSAGHSKNLGMKFNSVYRPIFKWTFKWNDNEYEIQHQYTGSSSLRSTSVQVEQWNKIEPVNE